MKTLLEDNPNLDPLHMRLGERILIRKKQIGSEDEAGTKEQWEEYRQSLNSVAEEGTAYHIVHPGETFYSLSRRFGITEAEFSALNGGLKPADLKAGAMVKIPAPEAGQVPEGADSLQRQDSVPEAGQQVVQIDFRRSGPATRSTWRCCCHRRRRRGQRQLPGILPGVLLGLDSVKLKYGRSVNVNLYNTARDTARIRGIVESDAFRNADLIVGPVYEEGLYPVIRFSRGEKDPRGVAAGQYRGDEQRRAVPARARPFAQVREGGRPGEWRQKGHADLHRVHRQGVRARDARTAGRFGVPPLYL